MSRSVKAGQGTRFDVKGLQKEYLDQIEPYFSKGQRLEGEAAFSNWEGRLLAFLAETAPTLTEKYRQDVQSRQPSYLFGTTIHQSWRRTKGEAVKGFLAEAAEFVGRRRLTGKARPRKSTSAVAVPDPAANGPTDARRVFIGHGKSNAWKDLKEFLQDRLGLPWDEFNREPAAGLSTIERLLAMLDQAAFAFIVLTAEDEHGDGELHARENVIHEAGLFQGRLGFQRAIVLIEEGCAEFSNIKGLTQIRFPNGGIMSQAEELRRVLEREGMLQGR